MSARPSPRSGWIAALVCACVASGCATEYDRHHDFAEGWRVARVEKIGGDLEAPGLPANDCRSITLSASAPGPSYADVWFVEHRRFRRRIVLLPSGGAVAVGDNVYVNVRECTVPAVPVAKAAP